MDITENIDNQLNEDSESGAERIFRNKFKINIKKTDIKKTIIFHLNEGINEMDFNNFRLIDNIISMLEKKYKGSIIKHDYNKFIVTEL